MKKRVRYCGKCRAPMERTSERVHLFYGHVCRSCTRMGGMVEQIAEGLAKIIERHK
jgi:hypothetical protein